MRDKPLDQQLDFVIKVLLKNHYVSAITKANPFPDNKNWYLGAGCLAQTVWNYLSGFKIDQGIKDYDLVYYNPDNTSKEGEEKEQRRITKLFSELPIKVEVVNEARVHLWFKEDFGRQIDQYKSCEDAVNTWPTTATAMGVNIIGKKVDIYAPYGLNDLLGMIVRPNKPSVIRWVYEEKVKRWSKIWPNLNIIGWEQG